MYRAFYVYTPMGNHKKPYSDSSTSASSGESVADIAARYVASLSTDNSYESLRELELWLIKSKVYQAVFLEVVQHYFSASLTPATDSTTDQIQQSPEPGK